VLLLRQLAPQPRHPNVAILIPQTSLLLQLPPLPAQVPHPLAAAPLQETAPQAVPPRQLLPPWLLCETSVLAHSLLVLVLSLAPFSKQLCPGHSKSVENHLSFRRCQCVLDADSTICAYMYL
jgi:hypothetical protein